MRVVNDTYAVFFDTNTVKGKYWIDHTVRQKAVTIKDDTMVKIDLYLPEVVQKEWSRYYVRHAKEQYDKISDASTKLLDMSFDALTTEVFDEAKVNKNSTKYLKSLGFNFVPTPHDEIDYKELVELAIKHSPPFEPTDGSDKGLKDAIIAHTIKDFAAKHPDTKIVFIGRDGLMTTYLHKLMPAKDSFTLCDSIEDFAEIMKLTNSKLNKELAKGASDAFFVQDVQSTFYYSLNIRDLLIGKYRAKIVDAETARKYLQNVRISPDSDIKKSINNGQWSTRTNQILIPDSSFEKKENNRLFWTVELDFVQNYNVDMPTSAITGLPVSYLIKHTVVYRVSWTAELTDGGDLINPKIELVEEPDESQTIKIQNSLGNIDSFSALKQLLNSNTTISGIADASAGLSAATDSISNSLKQISLGTQFKDYSKLAVPDISTQLNALKPLVVPTIPGISLDTKPPTIDPILPTLNIHPKIDGKDANQ